MEDLTLALRRKRIDDSIEDACYEELEHLGWLDSGNENLDIIRAEAASRREVDLDEVFETGDVRRLNARQLPRHAAV